MRKTNKNDLEVIRRYAKIRWPFGMACPMCQSKSVSELIDARGIWQCLECRKQFGIFKGTTFEGTRLSPYKLDETIKFFVKQSLNNYEEIWSPTPKEFKAKDYSRTYKRWKGVIGVRALERGIGTYATAQRLHKKLATIPFTSTTTVEAFIKHILK